MRLHIIHTTEYFYTDAVALNPHLLRLMPRHSQRQRLLDFDLSVDPAPVQNTLIQGFEGSLAHHLFFSGLTSHLAIRTNSELNTLPSTSIFSLYPQEAYSLPLNYSPFEKELLTPFLQDHDYQRSIRTFTEDVLEANNRQTLPFLHQLTYQLSRQITKEYREFGWPFQPHETLQRGSGSCRDIALLFMACVRYSGLAARFVSGYYFDEVRALNSELHAWVEVFLPGAGWCGYDPTYGVVAGEGHVDICASAFPQLCSPLEGTFIGSAQQRLHSSVEIHRLE
jgi:transglutaminase-like putative cysteine protease